MEKKFCVIKKSKYYQPHSNPNVINLTHLMLISALWYCISTWSSPEISCRDWVPQPVRALSWVWTMKLLTLLQRLNLLSYSLLSLTELVVFNGVQVEIIITTKYIKKQFFQNCFHNLLLFCYMGLLPLQTRKILMKTNVYSSIVTRSFQEITPQSLNVSNPYK